MTTPNAPLKAAMLEAIAKLAQRTQLAITHCTPALPRVQGQLQRYLDATRDARIATEYETHAAITTGIARAKGEDTP